MSLSIPFDIDYHAKKFWFLQFPTAKLDYEEAPPQNSYITLHPTDSQTGTISTIFIKTIDLQNVGFSLSTWNQVHHNHSQLDKFIQTTAFINHQLIKAKTIVDPYLPLSPLAHRMFFKNIPLATRHVVFAIFSKKLHVKVQSPMNISYPGIYLSRTAQDTKIFVNLKKSEKLGEGTFGKARTVLWLNPPDTIPQIIVKKVWKNQIKEVKNCQKEIEFLTQFQNKRGLLPLIAGGLYNDKYAIFTPLYACDLRKQIKSTHLSLSLTDKLEASLQWLEGLATLSKIGIHGDIKPCNMFLKKNSSNTVEAVIGDFGAFAPLSNPLWGTTTPAAAPPEYWKHNIDKTLDVWSMGLVLYELFSTKRLCCWSHRNEKEMADWTSRLAFGWIRVEGSFSHDTPVFVQKIIDEMLHPDPKQRLSAKEALEYFTLMRSDFETN